MISILNGNNLRYVKFVIAVLVTGALFLITQSTLAQTQNRLSLSVTPSLFEMAASPGQVWKSSIKVINPNPYDITVYASAVNFAPQGEAGNGRFIPVIKDMTEGSTLAEWMTISSEPITIASERSVEVPIMVEVPEGAAPGGHFAAILVGTKPPEGIQNTFQVQTSQIVTSLFFVRIAGDVQELGSIRSFRTTDSFVQVPEADFELRFENKGNVHLQPRGNILIYNMWGKERGDIPINQHTHFGNVLPQSIRQFNFTWKGEPSITDIGRYKAVVSLGYGADSKQFVTSTIHFWVVPLKAAGITLISIIAFIYFVSWCIRSYVRRMLYQAGLDARVMERPHVRAVARKEATAISDVRLGAYETISSPVRSGIVDLRERLSGKLQFIEKLRAVVSFIFTYKIFFVSVFLLIAGFAGIFWYIQSATVPERAYEVTLDSDDADVHISSEELKLRELALEAQLPGLEEKPESQQFSLEVINRSGDPGTAAERAALLMEGGYSVQSVGTDEARTDKRSVVVYDVAVQEDALAISRILDGALLSARTASSSETTITVFVGEDAIKD